MATTRNIVQFSALFPRELYEKIKQRAADEDLSLSQLLRRLAREYLEADTDTAAA